MMCFLYSIEENFLNATSYCQIIQRGNNIRCLDNLGIERNMLILLICYNFSVYEGIITSVQNTTENINSPEMFFHPFSAFLNTNGAEKWKQIDPSPSYWKPSILAPAHFFHTFILVLGVGFISKTSNIICKTQCKMKMRGHLVKK